MLERLEADLSTVAAVTAAIAADPAPPIAADMRSTSRRPTVHPGEDPLRGMDFIVVRERLMAIFFGEGSACRPMRRWCWR